MLVDEKSYDLAEYFLEDFGNKATPQLKQSLAEDIQRAVEDWFSEHEDFQS